LYRRKLIPFGKAAFIKTILDNMGNNPSSDESSGPRKALILYRFLWDCKNDKIKRIWCMSSLYEAG